MIASVLGASFIIAIILILRLCVRRIASPRLVYALWLAVVLRLAMPFTVGELVVPMVPLDSLVDLFSPMGSTSVSSSAIESAESTAVADETRLPDSVSVADAPEPILPGVSVDAAPPSEPSIVDADVQKPDPVRIFAVIWTVGTLAVGAFFLLSWTLFYSRIRADRRLVEHVGCLRVYESESVGGCCLIGLIPAIYLTPEASSDSRRELIIAHELGHFRHGDFIWAFVRTLACAIWWWNPLIWLAARLSRRDAELACDDSVAHRLDSDGIIEYARLLVDSAELASVRIALCGGELKERIVRLTSQIGRKGTSSVIAAVFAVAAMLGAVGCSFIGAKPIGIGHSLATGRYLDGVCPMIILEDGNSPVTMTCDFPIDDLTDGDLIRVELDLILYTYPGQTTVYAIEKLEDGELSDIDPTVLEELIALGHYRPDSERKTSRGLYFNRGTHFIILEGEDSPIMLRPEKGASFDGITSGDLIEITHTDFRLFTDPPQMSVYSVKKIADGTEEDFDDPAILAGFGVIPTSSYEGRFLRIGDKCMMLLDDFNGSPAACYVTPSEYFAECTDGDLVSFTANFFHATNPMQVGVFSARKISDGSQSDLNSTLIAQLVEMSRIDISFATQTMSGRFLYDSGGYLITDSPSSPFKLWSPDAVDLAGFTDGDMIEVECSTLRIWEQQPRLIVYSAKKLADGDSDDIDARQLDYLKKYIPLENIN